MTEQPDNYFSHSLGGGRGLSIACVGIAQGHFRLRVTKEFRNDGKRRFLHDRVTGICVPQVVEANVIDSGSPADEVPE